MREPSSEIRHRRCHRTYCLPTQQNTHPYRPPPDAWGLAERVQGRHRSAMTRPPNGSALSPRAKARPINTSYRRMAITFSLFIYQVSGRIVASRMPKNEKVASYALSASERKAGVEMMEISATRTIKAPIIAAARSATTKGMCPLAPKTLIWRRNSNMWLACYRVANGIRSRARSQGERGVNSGRQLAGRRFKVSTHD